MKGIILDPTNAERSAKITGKLGVQQSDIGTGGEANFTLDGSATGNITIPTVPAAVGWHGQAQLGRGWRRQDTA